MDEIKKKIMPVGQYAFETKNLDGPPEKFLEETAPLIGYIVHRFNTLEESVNSEICELINDRCDSTGLLIIYNMNYSSKVELFERLINNFQDMLEKKIPSFTKFINQLKDVGKLRNSVVHADWESAHDDGFALSKVKIKSGRIDQEYTQFTPESLQKIIDLIDETIDMFELYDEEKQEIF